MSEPDRVHLDPDHVRKRKSRMRRGSYYHELEPEKLYQTRLSASMALCIGTLIYYAKEYSLTIYNVSAIINGILMAHFFVLFFKIILSCHSLHHVRVKRRRSSLGNQLFIPYDVETDYEEPLSSVSAMIGLRGSNAEKLVSSLVYLVIGNSLMAVTMNIVESDQNYYTNMMIVLGLFALWLILTWPLEFTLKSDWPHYFGVIVGLPCTFASLLIQQQWSAVSILLTLMAIVNGMAYSVIFLCKFERQHVHWQSWALLTLESVVLCCSSTAGSVYIYNLTA